MRVLVQLLEKYCEILYLQVTQEQCMHVWRYVLYSTWAVDAYSCHSCATGSCSCTVLAVNAYKPFKSWTTYVFNIETEENIGYQCWCLLLVVSVYVAHTQNSLYHFRTVVTHATFGLLAVAALLVSGYGWLNKRWNSNCCEGWWFAF